MVLTDEERKARRKARESTPEFKAKQKAYNARPDVKAKREARQQTPEYKANDKEYRNKPENKIKSKARKKKYDSRPEAKTERQEYRSRPDVQAKIKKSRNKPENLAKVTAYQQTPEYKAKAKLRRQTPEYKAKTKAYNARPDVMAREKERYSRPDVKAKQRELRLKPKRIAAAAAYRNRNDIVAKRKNTRYDKRLMIFQHYSKLHSNSDIPCCRCCGEKSHLDFLNIDHTLEKKKMDSIKELVEIGYSSKLGSISLDNWLIEHNYLLDFKTEYFQILCTKCNFAKGMKKNNNECPMKGKPH